MPGALAGAPNNNTYPLASIVAKVSIDTADAIIVTTIICVGEGCELNSLFSLIKEKKKI